MLPAPLRGAATLLAVLALAALLTTVRHNASAYLTGVWDTGSQTLVYGRIHQMEQGQHAPGGFLGVYTDDWSDDTNRALFRDDTPTDAAAFHPYTHQSGLQGWLFGRVNRLLRHRLPDGLAREAALYWLNSTLFYAAELLVALAVWEEFGPLAAAFGFASVLLAPWLQRGMKDLYWCLWTWLLPLLAALWLCHCTRVRGKTPRGCWPLVAAACMVRCMCGFEFITTFLILCEIPLCYAAAKAYFVRRDPHGALVWLGRTVGAGVSALGGVAAALALWFSQEWLCFGSAADAWQNMTRAVTDRVSLTDGAVRDVGEIRKYGVPTWCRGATPKTGKCRIEAMEINGPVVLAGIQINPGDLIIADDSGICAVPPQHAAYVLKKCQEILPDEEVMRELIERDAPISEIKKLFRKRYTDDDNPNTQK